MQAKTENRNQFVDIMRGIAMLLVVLGHTMTGCSLTTLHDCSLLTCIVVKGTCNVVHCTSPRPNKTRTLRRW